MPMSSNAEINDSLLLQAITPGTEIPSTMPARRLFLLNLNTIVTQEIWDNMGDKELIQSSQLRALAGHLIKMADLLDELGHYLSALPDPYDYEAGDFEQSWEEINDEADNQLTDDYAKLSAFMNELSEDAIGDFLD
jgi:hypothetical protein